MASIGEDFARAVAAKDREAFARLLADVYFDHWFEPTDTIEALLDVSSGDDVADTRRVSYRLDLANEDGPQVAEQQAYYRTTDGRISHLRVLCSGFRPRP